MSKFKPANTVCKSDSDGMPDNFMTKMVNVSQRRVTTGTFSAGHIYVNSVYDPDGSIFAG